MDFWLVAAVAGAGYVSKYWQNISRNLDRNSSLLQLSSEDSNLKKPESPSCPLRGLPGTKRRGNVAKGRNIVDTSLYDITSIDDASGAEVASTSGNLGSYLDLGALSASNFHPDCSETEEFRQYESGDGLARSFSNDYIGLSPNPCTEEIDSSNGSMRNRSSLRTKLSRGHFVKPMNSLESCLMAQLYKEHAEMEEYVLSSLPSPATPNTRALFVTDGRRVIGNAHRHLFNAETGTAESKLCKEASLENNENVYGVPPLPRIGSLDPSKKMKAKTENGQNGKLNNSSAKTNGKDLHPQGSPDGIALFCLGISIGIISSFMACKSEVDKVKELLKQSENLVQDLHEELELKDSLIVKELVSENYELQDTTINSISERPSDGFPSGVNSNRHDGGTLDFQKAGESSESISNIEAELEAELERLGLNMNASNLELERRLSDVIELDPDFSADFAQGELRVDILRVESKSNEEEDTTATSHSANYAVSPRELSMRLHEVIQSRLEERVNELETALHNSQRKIQIMESGRRNWGELANSPLRFSPMQEREDNSMSPVVMNLSGQALEAYKEACEELMKMSDSEEEDSPRRIYEDIPCPGDGSEEKPSHIRMQEEHISLVLGSNETSNSRDELSDCDDELERELIKQIVERTKKGSPVVINAQKLLFSLDENKF